MRLPITNESQTLPEILSAEELVIAGEAKDGKTAYNVLIQNLQANTHIYIEAADDATVNESVRIPAGGGTWQQDEVDLSDINLIAGAALNDNVRFLFN